MFRNSESLAQKIVGILLFTAAQGLAAEEPVPQTIKFERQVLEFAPTRPDLTVGIAWFTVLTPDKDWTVKFDESEKQNFKDQGDLKFLDLKQVGKNRFELPDISLERTGEKNGAVCMSVKIWFNELPNERLFFFEKIEDRYSQLSYCSRDVPEAQHHFSQNRVATLEEFRDHLKKPIALNLTQHGMPWRPGIMVDDQGGVYFHSLLVGRFSAAGQSPAWGVPGPLTSHREQIWKLNSDGTLKELPRPNDSPAPRDFKARQWQQRMRSLATDRFGTLISIALNELVGCDQAGNFYADFVTSETNDSPELYQVAKIDADGQARAIAGSTRGHKDGPAKEAQFSRITALTVGRAGDIYVADGTPETGSWIRRIAPDGTVTTIAGCDKVGFADGKRDAAQFYCPSGITADASGNLYVADPINARVRKITPAGVVSTVAGGNADDVKGDQSLAQPSGVAIGPNGELYVLDGAQKMARVRRLHADGKLETLVVVDSKTKASDAAKTR